MQARDPGNSMRECARQPNLSDQRLMDAPFHRGPWRRLTACLVFSGMTASVAASPSVPGSGDFEICQSCHGIHGEGIQTLQAPRIAGLDTAYVTRQLTDFRQGRRGATGADTPGGQMAVMANTLSDEATVARVAAYIASLPDVRVAATVSGNSTAGRALFAVCVACHGAKAEGSVSAGAPRLVGMSDWYLLRQLQDFRAGRRGGVGAESGAAAMRTIALTLPTSQSLLDVIAFLDSLSVSASAQISDQDRAPLNHANEVLVACGR